MFKNFDSGMVKYYLREFSLKETKTIVEMDLYYENSKSDPGPVKVILEILKVELWDLITLVLCCSIGHDFQDDTGPNAGETGEWSYSCSRCGFGHSGYMTG